ncbi:MAG: oligosaccharide flippase family protein [Clostridia bacterium]|nr:oligosaccharide flippase family protein [Clostridia bacterium]
MDKKRAILNITISITTKVILLALALLSKRFLIQFTGNEANGLYTLYTSIIGFLAVAELGIGAAISFSMYKPIVEGDDKKVAGLYNLYKKVYYLIGIIILVIGVIITPVLPYLVKNYSGNYNLYLTFLIMLIAVVLTYVYSAKTSLINAYKNNYITTLINSISILFRTGMQILILYLTSSFLWYLFLMIFGTVLEWILTEIYTRKRYKNLITTNEQIDIETKIEVKKNIKAMFMHKIGAVIYASIDNIIISAFIGISILGLYSNYILIATSLVGILGLFFNPLTSIIGHLCAADDENEKKKYFKFMYFLNFTLGIIFFLGYYAVIDNVINICFGDDLLITKDVSFVITLSSFINYMRQTIWIYRDAMGIFYYNRWQPIIEVVVNIVLSIAFVYLLGITGVIIATILSNIFICHIIEPYVLYKHGFKHENNNFMKNCLKYYIINYSLIGVFLCCMVVLHFCLQDMGNDWITLLVNGCIAVALALIPLIILFIVSKTYRQNVLKAFSYVLNLFKKLFNHKKEKID